MLQASGFRRRPKQGTQTNHLEESYRMLHNEATGLFEAPLTLLFDTRNPEEVEALHYWRGAFGPVTEIEAVNKGVFALHFKPGGWCFWDDPGEAA